MSNTETTSTNTYDPDNNIVTMPVTINKETRTLSFRVIPSQPWRASSIRAPFGCVTRTGTKIHRTNGYIELRDGEWKFMRRSGEALNKYGCEIVTWADQTEDPVKSQHVGTSIDREW